MSFIEDRDTILGRLREELVGPSPQGEEVDTSGPIRFPDSESSYGPWRQAGTGEEILQRDRPLRRYGIGVLYPMSIPLESDPAEGDDGTSTGDPGPGVIESSGEEEILTESAQKELHKLSETVERASSGLLDPDPDDFDLSTANDYRPNTMAVSFLARFPASSQLRVRMAAGRYGPKRVQVSRDSTKGKADDFTQTWWIREPVELEADLDTSSFSAGAERMVRPDDTRSKGVGGFILDVAAYVRPRADGQALVTVCLTNKTNPSQSSIDECALFQCWFEVSVTADGDSALILPYPTESMRSVGAGDPEEESFDLLYRDAQTFAVGHGCSADWKKVSDDRARSVTAECLPVVETPSTTPEIYREDGSEVVVPMGPLAGLDDENDGLEAVREVIDLYGEWIEGEANRSEVAKLTPQRANTAKRHLELCRDSLTRMKDGLDFLGSDPVVNQAFRLANHAVLLQQLRTRRTPRDVSFDSKQGRLAFEGDVTVPDWRTVTGRGSWRPFQIAFLLMNLRSIARGDDVDRETVELIWFPTGGGKTEAYLGLSAFALFHHRLMHPADSGVGVLMRYTLRLLTAQQFQRAASLICAMEHLRRNPDLAGHDDRAALGEAPFSIGIWLGMATTPNLRAEARSILKKLNQGDKYTENKFALLRCPWCSAQMGPFATSGKGSKFAPKVAGYEAEAGTVRLKCPDVSCEFTDGLPVYVIDEDIYDVRPSLVIGTVDKFASLAWKPKARALFGLDASGGRIAFPPYLIIQDELHLISGPLGSMVGLYEAVIEELCIDDSQGKPVRPKIVGSTATIRRYEEQIKALYARPRTALFPPRALDASNSFFARYAETSDGELLRGRIYVGVHGGGLGSVQTAQVRTFAALLQAVVPFEPPRRDPWWTMMIFFNSLRELGTSLSLMQSDIPDYLKVVKNRLGLQWKDVRRLRHILELTGRMRSDEVPRAIEQLSTDASSSAVVDVCLASNIIEVGIDIERLSLLTVVGQPKTTAQYIQVTGRVGRNWKERPGLIATIYSPSRPRDRSHFEKFRSYHERLYAQVEPTSVTPFAPPVLARALHAVMVSYVRQKGVETLAPYPVPTELLDEIHDALSRRVGDVDPEEAETLEDVFVDRLREWEHRKRSDWDGSTSGDIPMLRRAGEYATRVAAQLSWATPTSMRNVDAECQAEITRLYLLAEEQVVEDA